MRSWRANFTALLIAEALAMIGFGISAPVIPLFLEEDIGMTDPVKLKLWVGLINSSTALTMAIFAPIWGHLADVFNRRAMLLRAMFGGAIIISFMTFVTSAPQLLILKTIQGCLTGTVAAATVMTASIAPATHVAFALGLLQTVIAVGNSLGPLVGGLISDFFGHRPAFFSTGLTLALSGFFVLKWVDKDEGPSAAKKREKFTLIPDMRPVISSPLLMTLMLVTLGVHSANNAATPLLPLFLKSLVTDVSGSAFIASSTGIIMGLGAASTAIAAVLAGKFSAKAGYRKTLFFCLVAGAIVTIPQTFVTNVYQLGVLRTLSSFFIGGTVPVISAIIAVSSEKKHQGTIFGIDSSVTSAGHALGPMIGSAAAILSYRAAFLASAVILFISAFAAVRRRSPDSAPGQ